LASIADDGFRMLHVAATQAQTLSKLSTTSFGEPADAFASGAISACIVNGIVESAMHPESIAAGKNRRVAPRPLRPDANALLDVGRRSPRADVAIA